MDRTEFSERYPRLFHMAAAGSWPSINDRGLLATRTLVDLYNPPAEVAEAILNQVRQHSFTLTAAGLPDATVRDQRPLKFIDRCLLPGVTTQQFLDELNGRVFFHVSETRLTTLLSARAYRRLPHDVLTLDTARFLAANENVSLAPYNTGSVHVPNMPRRGPETFVPLAEYPWEYWRSKRGEKNAVVELTVTRSANVTSSVIHVERWDDGNPSFALHEG